MIHPIMRMRSHLLNSTFIDPFWEPWYIERDHAPVHLQKLQDEIKESEDYIRKDPALKCIVAFRFVFDVMVTESLCDVNDIPLAEDIIEKICEDPSSVLTPHEQQDDNTLLHKILKNFYKGFEWVDNLTMDTSLSNEMICELHKIILQGDAFAHHSPGVFRTVHAKPHSHVHPYTISVLLQNLCQIVNDEAEDHTSLPDRIRLACWFFVEFLRIQPFERGNGRTARLLMYLILRSVTSIPCGFCIGTNARRNRARYLEAFDRYDDNFLTKGTSDMCTLALHSMLWSALTLHECFTTLLS
jgi:fido (protein-threonine AMPylation protein)